MINMKKILKEKNMSIKECAEFYDIPYATLYAIVNQTASLDDCKFSTIKKLSKITGIPAEYLSMETSDFYTFRSNLHHSLKREGALNLRNQILIKKMIDAYIDDDQYGKGVYFIALV